MRSSKAQMKISKQETDGTAEDNSQTATGHSCEGCNIRLRHGRSKWIIQEESGPTNRLDDKTA